MLSSLEQEDARSVSGEQIADPLSGWTVEGGSCDRPVEDGVRHGFESGRLSDLQQRNGVTGEGASAAI